MKHLFPLLLPFTLPVLAAPTPRTSAADDAPALPAVLVTATPVTQDETVSTDGADSVWVSRDQLTLLNAQDLPTALRQVPGLTISRYSPIGSYGGAQGGSVYIRGMGTARPGGEIRMYTDGAPRGSGLWSHPLMDALPIDFAESVTVQKSPHPARCSDAFGAVDVQTRRRREQGSEGEGVLGYGRGSTFLFAGSGGLKDGPVDAYGGIAYKYSDGLRDHNRSILRSAYGRLGVDLSPQEHLGFIYQRTDSQVEDPGEKRKPAPRTDRFDLVTDLYTLRFDTERDTITGYSLLSFERGTVDWLQDDLCRTPAGAMDGNAHTDWLNFAFRNFYDWNVGDAFWLTGGFDVVSESGETETRNLENGQIPFSTDGRLNTLSLYLGIRNDFALTEDWTLTPSIGSRRYVHSEYDPEWSPAAALTLDWRETVRFFLNGSRGIHYPGVYTRAVSADYAGGSLDAETMDSVSGGAKVSAGDAADVLLTVFHTDAKNRIDKTAKGYINAGAMRASGVELSGHWRPSGRLAFFGGLTYTNPETTPVSRLPRWLATAGCTWKICDYLKWTLDGQFIDKMNAYSMRSSADAAELRELKAGFLLNTRLAVPLESITPVNGELFVALENLTHSDYAYYPDYPIGGIMWYVGCRFKF
jgi:iron complex outermembrane receptor protein